MTSKDYREYRKRYQRYHHHAWAGTVMLSLLLALRIFLEISDIPVDDRFIVPLGVLLIAYTSVALFLSYRYRSGLEAEEERTSEAVERARLEAEVERERIRAEEKMAKAEAKIRKKVAKAAAKARKKALKEQEKDG